MVPAFGFETSDEEGLSLMQMKFLWGPCFFLREGFEDSGESGWESEASAEVFGGVSSSSEIMG